MDDGPGSSPVFVPDIKPAVIKSGVTGMKRKRNESSETRGTSSFGAHPLDGRPGDTHIDTRTWELWGHTNDAWELWKGSAAEEDEGVYWTTSGSAKLQLYCGLNPGPVLTWRKQAPTTGRRAKARRSPPLRSKDEVRAYYEAWKTERNRNLKIRAPVTQRIAPTPNPSIHGTSVPKAPQTIGNPPFSPSPLATASTSTRRSVSSEPPRPPPRRRRPMAVQPSEEPEANTTHPATLIGEPTATRPTIEPRAKRPERRRARSVVVPLLPKSTPQDVTPSTTQTDTTDGTQFPVNTSASIHALLDQLNSRIEHEASERLGAEKTHGQELAAAKATISKLKRAHESERNEMEGEIVALRTQLVKLEKQVEVGKELLESLGKVFG